MRQPANRLGIQGAQSVKSHPWLRYFVWKDLYDKKLKAPFIPEKTDNWDKKYCEYNRKIGYDTKERYQEHLRQEMLRSSFSKFNYIADGAEENALFPNTQTCFKEENEDLDKEYVHFLTTDKKQKSTLKLGKLATNYTKLRQRRKTTMNNTLMTVLTEQSKGFDTLSSINN